MPGLDAEKEKRRLLRRQSTTILLGNANYYGTLAAVRSLGRAGVNVVTVDSSRISHSRYSRYSSQHLKCPAFEDSTHGQSGYLEQLVMGRAGRYMRPVTPYRSLWLVTATS